MSAPNTHKNDFRELLNQLGIRPNRKLGQIFLVDEKVINNQIQHAELTKNDTVLEIGPGLGILTSVLAGRVKNVIAVEFDKKLCSYLTEVLPENVTLICDDALYIDFPKFNKIVSNVPYQISSPLIFKLIKYQFDAAVFMFQAEFAERLIAVPNTKKYSRLTVMSTYYYDIDLISHVNASSFIPVPKISSAIVKMVPRKELETAIDEKLFTDFIRVIFSERRKMIKNSVKSHFSQLYPSKPQLKKSEISDIITQLPHSNARPEQLSLSQLIQMSDILHQLLSDRTIKI